MALSVYLNIKLESATPSKRSVSGWDKQASFKRLTGFLYRDQENRRILSSHVKYHLLLTEHSRSFIAFFIRKLGFI